MTSENITYFTQNRISLKQNITNDIFTDNESISDTEFIQGLICTRRYDILAKYIDLFSNIPLAALDEIQILEGASIADLLLKESPKSTLSNIINKRAEYNFGNESFTTSIKLLKYLLSQIATDPNACESLIPPILELIRLLQNSDNITTVNDLLTSYITQDNILKFLSLLKYIAFNNNNPNSFDEIKNNSDASAKTFILKKSTRLSDIFTCQHYENNVLMKLITVIDLDSTDELQESIKQIITYVLQDKNININLIDKSGNTLLSNCLHQYSIKKIMYLIELKCNPTIKNPITGENLVNEIKTKIKKLKRDNNKDTIYYYYKIIMNYFKMCNYKIKSNKINIGNVDTCVGTPNVNQQYGFKWFKTYCKIDN